MLFTQKKSNFTSHAVSYCQLHITVQTQHPMTKHIAPKQITPFRKAFTTVIISLATLFTATAAAAPRSTGNITAETADTMPRHRLHNDLYRVRISTDNGRRRIKVHGALVSDITRRDRNNIDTTGAARTLMGFAMFTDDFTSPVTVRVRRRGQPFDSVEVRPAAYAIPTRRISRRTVEFTLERPTQKVSVEFDGDRARNLFVLPDLPDTAAPRASSPDTLYFGEGEHHAGLITLRSGQTLYIDEGAVVYGTVRSYDTHDITIAGRGILCGSYAPHHLDTRRVMVDLPREITRQRPAGRHKTDLGQARPPHLSAKNKRSATGFVTSIQSVSCRFC